MVANLRHRIGQVHETFAEDHRGSDHLAAHGLVTKSACASAQLAATVRPLLLHCAITSELSDAVRELADGSVVEDE
ncbi:hypothetical protein [Streptomyces mirabilis]|uniref:hypothetical protein n=1 Tax=Streptomyces mirabilis TaxID=68239 RepID=UPI0036BCA28C